MAEFFIPGGVVAPLGVGGLLVVGLYHFGIMTEPMNLFMTWVFSSLTMVVGVRVVCSQFFPGEAITVDDNQRLEGYGQTVEVTETVKPGEKEGRICYQGTTWSATSIQKEIPKGKKAKLVAYDNITWLVEPLDDDEIDELAD
jgi:hypothetical protein